MPDEDGFLDRVVATDHKALRRRLTRTTNPLFLRYIERVLPSLGESGVLLATPGTLFPGVKPTRHDPPEVAKKPTYKQAWGAYHLSQTHEKGFFQDLLYQLCQGMDEPVRKGGRGRPPNRRR